MKLKLIHNPRCSKSREVLKMLKEKGKDFEVVEYLKNPLEESEILNLLKKLDTSPDKFLRKKEGRFKELKLKGELTLTAWASVISKNPIILERPILESETQAIIGRPPEEIFKIL